MRRRRSGQLRVPLQWLDDVSAYMLIITAQHQLWARRAANRLRKRIDRKPHEWAAFSQAEALRLAKRMSFSAKTRYKFDDALCVIDYEFWQLNDERRPREHAAEMEMKVKLMRLRRRLGGGHARFRELLCRINRGGSFRPRR